MSLRPHAVRFTTRVKDSSTGGSEYRSVERQAEGLVRLETNTLGLEFERAVVTTTMDGEGYSTDRTGGGIDELEIPLELIASVRVRRRWFLPRLQVETTRVRLLEGVPGARQGHVDLRIRHRDVQAARQLVLEVEVRQAELQLARARALEAREYDLLESQAGAGPEPRG